MVSKNDLPSINDIIFAINEAPLGSGEEARVYRIHPRPEFTLRVSNEIKDTSGIVDVLQDSEIIEQPDIFKGRNFAQTVAYFQPKKFSNMYQPIVTINRFCPGFSIDINKNTNTAQDEQEESFLALKRTLSVSEDMANLGDEAIDRIFDDLHFINPLRQSIDCSTRGLFTNNGNLIYSPVERCAHFIDLQPFINEAPGINLQHTKATNSPYFLAGGMLPGSYKFRKEHSSDPALIKLRTQILENVIYGAERNGLSDENNYIMRSSNDIVKLWAIRLSTLNIPEDKAKSMLAMITKIKDKPRYCGNNDKANVPYLRISGRHYS